MPPLGCPVEPSKLTRLVQVFDVFLHTSLYLLKSTSPVQPTYLQKLSQICRLSSVSIITSPVSATTLSSGDNLARELAPLVQPRELGCSRVFQSLHLPLLFVCCAQPWEMSGLIQPSLLDSSRLAEEHLAELPAFPRPHNPPSVQPG